MYHGSSTINYAKKGGTKMNNDIFARNAKLKQKLIAEYGEELFNKAVKEAFWLDRPYPRYVMAILRERKKGDEDMKSLEELAQQIKDILNAEYNPHCAVVITVDSAKVVSVEFSTPLS